MSIKTVRARRVGGMRFSIQTGSGHHVAIDDAAGDTAPRPIELLLAAQAGCTALDVASILAKKRQDVTGYEVDVAGEQRDDAHPHVFTRLDVVHEVEGPAIEVEAVRRAIELSATRYCSLTGMLSAGPVEIHHRYVVRRGTGLPADTGEVVVTGPNDDPEALGARWMARQLVGAAT